MKVINIGGLEKKETTMRTETIGTSRAHYFLYPGTLSTEELPKYLIINLVTLEICSIYKITMTDIMSKASTRTYTEPRHLIAYLLKKLLNDKITLVEIGKKINRKHNTVIHAVQKVKNWMATNKEFKKKVQAIELKIACSY